MTAVLLIVLKVIGIVLASIVGLLLLALIILLLTRVDLLLKFSEDGFLVRVGAWGFKATVFQSGRKKKRSEKKSEKKPKKAKKPKKEKKKPEEPEEESGGLAGDYLEYIKLALDALGGSLRSIFVKRLRIKFVAASKDDPAAAALRYGAAWSAVGAITPLLEKNRNVKSYSFDIQIDYDAPSPLLYFLILLRAPVWRFVIIGLRFGFKALKIYRKSKKEKRN